MRELFPFQRVMVDKFIDVKACLLGDDMGLGKTVQSVELDAQKRKKHGPAFKEKYKGKLMTLVVTRLSVLGVWADHFRDWNPGLKVMVIDRKDRASFVEAVLKGKADVYICHYEAMRMMESNLRKVRWFHVIADECHAIKNRNALVTKALKHLTVEHKLAASGTAADNAPDDFWSVLNWLYPNTFTSYWSFYNRHVLFREIVNEYTGRRYREVVGVADTHALQKQLAPFYLRRLKDEVAKDLPEKYYTTIWVDLTPIQRRAYEQMRRNMLAWVGTQEDQPMPAPVVIAQLIRLQQFACAYGELQTVKRRKAKGCDKDPKGKDYHQHNPYTDMCINCEEYLIEEREVLKLIEPSSKLDTVMEILEDNPKQQVAVFGWSKQVIHMLAARLKAKDIPVGTLTGDTAQGDRDSLIANFQAGKLRVFAGTISAGGVGITLTAASTVVFVDRAWSPSANRQAEDRLHRIGQKNAVQVIDLVARNTVDLGRIQKINLKWTWLKAMLGDQNELQEGLHVVKDVSEIEDWR